MDGVGGIPGLERFRFGGHGGELGVTFRDRGEDWAELALPFALALVGDPATGAIATGPIVALMDMATSIAVWAKRGGFVPHATLDLRLDQLRTATSGRTLIGRGECYRLAGSVAFVRGQAHDGDPLDPVAHVTGTFMTLVAAG